MQIGRGPKGSESVGMRTSHTERVASLTPSLSKGGGRTAVTYQVRQKCCNSKVAERRRAWQKYFLTVSKNC